MFLSQTLCYTHQTRISDNNSGTLSFCKLNLKDGIASLQFMNLKQEFVHDFNAGTVEPGAVAPTFFQI